MTTFAGDRFTKPPGQPGFVASVDSRWRTLGTAAVSDALDRLGIVGQALGIRPLTPSLNAVGRAFTVRFVPSNQVMDRWGSSSTMFPPVRLLC